MPWPFEESERQCSGRSAGEDLRTESARRCEIFSSWRCTQIPDMSGHAVMVGDASRAASGALPSILATSKESSILPDRAQGDHKWIFC